MNTNVTTWRDLISELTPEQIAELEYCEQHQIPPGLDTDAHRLNGARSMIRHNRAQREFAHVEPPADCRGPIDTWQQLDATTFTRAYTAWNVEVGSIDVEVMGTQYSDGRVIREIYCGGMDGIMAGQARRLAAALIDAADMIEQIDGNPYPVESDYYPCCGAIGRHGSDCDPRLK